MADTFALKIVSDTHLSAVTKLTKFIAHNSWQWRQYCNTCYRLLFNVYAVDHIKWEIPYEFLRQINQAYSLKHFKADTLCFHAFPVFILQSCCFMSIFYYVWCLFIQLSLWADILLHSGLFWTKKLVLANQNV